MRFPNWFRITWWALITLGLLGLFASRWHEIRSGASAPVDVVIFLALLGLLLAPIFQEVQLFGIGLKQQVERLATQVGDLRAEVRTSLDIRNVQSQSISVYAPPTPEQLQRLQQEARENAQRVQTAHGLPQGLAAAEVQAVTDETVFLFKARYALERLLRRWYRYRVGPIPEGGIPITRITRALVEEAALEPDDAIAAEELYRIASRAIHGGTVSQEEMAFARDIATWLLAELRANERTP